MSEIDAAWRHFWSYLILLCWNFNECHLHCYDFRHSLNDVSFLDTKKNLIFQKFRHIWSNYSLPKLLKSYGRTSQDYKWSFPHWHWYYLFGLGSILGKRPSPSHIIEWTYWFGSLYTRDQGPWEKMTLDFSRSWLMVRRP